MLTSDELKELQDIVGPEWVRDDPCTGRLLHLLQLLVAEQRGQAVDRPARRRHHAENAGGDLGAHEILQQKGLHAQALFHRLDHLLRAREPENDPPGPEADGQNHRHR